jgi:hypothetical protein
VRVIDTLRMTGFAVAASGRGRLLLKTPEGKIAHGEQKANTIFAFVSPTTWRRLRSTVAGHGYI